MIEVKISFSTPDELVAFFTKPQALTTGTHTPQYKIELPQASDVLVGTTVNGPASGGPGVSGSAPIEEQALPEEPALKPKKAARGKKETRSTQAESGANNLGSASPEAPSAETPSPGGGAVSTAGAEGVPPPVDAPAADVKFSIDDAREALKRLNDAQGIDAVRTLLSRMGANRISELPDAKYGELIAACPAA